MITDTDIRKMKAVFVTKAYLKKDLRSVETRIVTKVTNIIIDRINKLSDYFDEKLLNHEERINSLERRVNVIQPA